MTRLNRIGLSLMLLGLALENVATETYMHAVDWGIILVGFAMVQWEGD